MFCFVVLTKFYNLLFQLGFCHPDEIRSGIFQFSQAQVYVFLLVAFVYNSYLTLFAITSLVIFIVLCILLSYEFFILKFT